MGLRRMSFGLNANLRRGAILVLLVLAVFVFGVAAGSLTVNSLPAAQKGELGRFLEGFLTRYVQEREAIPAGEVFARATANHLKTAGLLWLLGLTTAGIPVILAILFLRGFTVGFTISFLFLQKGWNGLLLALATVVPPNLLAAPALLAIGAAAIAHALGRRARPVAAGRGRGRISPEFLAYTAFTAAMILLLTAAGFLEGYLAPAALRAIG